MSNTREWIQNTTRPPASLSYPHATVGQTLIGRPHCTARRVHQPCDPPTTHITSRASAGECVPPHAAPAKIVTHIPPPAQRASTRTSRVHRVTDAPAPVCRASSTLQC
jgi:hypothetical protein